MSDLRIHSDIETAPNDLKEAMTLGGKTQAMSPPQQLASCRHPYNEIERKINMAFMTAPTTAPAVANEFLDIQDRDTSQL